MKAVRANSMQWILTSATAPSPARPAMSLTGHARAPGVIRVGEPKLDQKSKELTQPNGAGGLRRDGSDSIKHEEGKPADKARS